MQRIAQGRGESSTRLRVVLQVLQERRWKSELLTGQDLCLLRLIEVVAPRVNRKPELQRTFPKIGLGESEYQVALAVADVGLHRERFAQSEKVVGRVAESDEGTGEPADAAGEADAVFALFMHLEREVNRPLFFVQVAFGHIGIVWFQLFEVAQLIQSEQAEFPQPRVVNVAFLEHDLAA